MLFIPLLVFTFIASVNIMLQPLIPQPSTEELSKENTDPQDPIIIDNKKPVIITNNIDESMLGYKHWTGTHKPDTFAIQVNGTVVKPGETYELDSPKEPVSVSYEYSFAKGMYKGSDTVSYQIKEDSDQASITFSWKDKPRVLIDNAEPLKDTQ